MSPQLIGVKIVGGVTNDFDPLTTNHFISLEKEWSQDITMMPGCMMELPRSHAKPDS